MTGLFISIEDYIDSEEDMAIEAIVDTVLGEQYLWYSSRMNSH